MDFKKIDEARKIMGLGESATLEEIRNAYRQLALNYHPDRSKHMDKKYAAEIFQKATIAYNIIIAYCANYRYSFKKQDAAKMIDKEMDEKYMQKFYDNWIVNFKKKED